DRARRGRRDPSVCPAGSGVSRHRCVARATMTRLTDALEAMSAADDRWSSIQAEGIEWIDHQLRYAAVTQEMDRRAGGQRSSGRGFRPVFGRFKPNETQPPTRAAMVWHAWMRSSTEYRADLDPVL